MADDGTPGAKIRRLGRGPKLKASSGTAMNELITVS
jgi:hypothetical protein